MDPLPVRKIPGIGNVSEQFLEGLNIKTCKDILDKILDIKIGFGDNSFEFFLSSALGLGRVFHETPQK